MLQLHPSYYIHLPPPVWVWITSPEILRLLEDDWVWFFLLKWWVCDLSLSPLSWLCFMCTRLSFPGEYMLHVTSSLCPFCSVSLNKNQVSSQSVLNPYRVLVLNVSNERTDAVAQIQKCCFLCDEHTNAFHTPAAAGVVLYCTSPGSSELLTLYCRADPRYVCGCVFSRDADSSAKGCVQLYLLARVPA